MREGSAGLGATSWSGTFGGAACRVTGRRALRRSTVAIFDEATGLRRRTGGPYPHVIRAALALPFIRSSRSHLRQPPHRVRPVTSLPGTGVQIPPAGATPCSANQVSLDDTLNRARHGRCRPAHEIGED